MSRKLGTFHGDSAFGTWLYRLGLNVVVSELRSGRVGAREVPAEDETLATGAARFVGEGVAAVLFQYPNYFGVVEDPAPIVAAAHQAGALAVAVVQSMRSAVGALFTLARPWLQSSKPLTPTSWASVRSISAPE